MRQGLHVSASLRPIPTCLPICQLSKLLFTYAISPASCERFATRTSLAVGRSGRSSLCGQTTSRHSEMPDLQSEQMFFQRTSGKSYRTICSRRSYTPVRQQLSESSFRKQSTRTLWVEQASWIIRRKKSASSMKTVRSALIAEAAYIEADGIASHREGRVFIHPSSTLFKEAKLKNGYLTYFNRSVTSKPFLRDATEVCYAPIGAKSTSHTIC